MTGKWKGWHALLLLVVVPGIIGLAGWYWKPLPAWFATMGLLVLSIFLAGWLATGIPRGLFVDDRNKVSLSRFQAVLWTILILSAFLVAAITNVREAVKDPLSIAIPGELWAVMGISATSLVGSPLLRGNKQLKPADPAEANKTLHQTGALAPTAEAVPTVNGLTLVDDEGRTLAKGQVAVNPTPSDSNWGDLFRGEETSNAATLDLGKAQMFYFTLILVLAYGVALGKLLLKGPAFTEFPLLDQGMLALLGISHAAYLVNKAVPRSQISA